MVTLGEVTDEARYVNIRHLVGVLEETDSLDTGSGELLLEGIVGVGQLNLAAEGGVVSV